MLPFRVNPERITRAPQARIASIDLIRGAVMILMAIDHVRVYSGVPPGGPTPAVFFSPWLFTNHPMGNPEAPEGYVWSLSLLYLVWGIAIVVLYFGCRWFAQFKAKRNAWWLKYL